MRNCNLKVSVLAVVLGLGFATSAFAEEAKVYGLFSADKKVVIVNPDGYNFGAGRANELGDTCYMRADDEVEMIPGPNPGVAEVKYSGYVGSRWFDWGNGSCDRGVVFYLDEKAAEELKTNWVKSRATDVASAPATNPAEPVAIDTPTVVEPVAPSDPAASGTGTGETGTSN